MKTKSIEIVIPTQFERELWFIQKKTFFPEKILAHIYKRHSKVPKKFQKTDLVEYDKIFPLSPMVQNLISKSEKIKKGNNISFVINTETGVYQFCRDVKVDDVQDVQFSWTDNGRGLRRCIISVEGKDLSETYINGGVITTIKDDVQEFIVNNGFSKPKVFFEYYSKDGSYDLVFYS